MRIALRLPAAWRADRRRAQDDRQRPRGHRHHLRLRHRRRHRHRRHRPPALDGRGPPPRDDRRGDGPRRRLDRARSRARRRRRRHPDSGDPVPDRPGRPAPSRSEARRGGRSASSLWPRAPTRSAVRRSPSGGSDRTASSSRRGRRLAGRGACPARQLRGAGDGPGSRPARRHADGVRPGAGYSPRLRRGLAGRHGDFGKMVAVRGPEIVPVPIEEAVRDHEARARRPATG